MDIVEGKNLRQKWDEWARSYKNKTALVFEDRQGMTSSFSYQELNDDINRAANLFLSLDIQKGDKVVLQMFNSPEFFISLFGLTKIGAVAVPINAHFLCKECAYIIKKCQPKAAVIEEAFLHIYQELQRTDEDFPIEQILCTKIKENNEANTNDTYIDFNKFLKRRSKILNEEISINSEDTAEIMFTSGTTGRPKGIVITHYNLIFAGFYTAWQGCITKDDNYLTVMPVWHIDCQCTVAMPSFTSGATFTLLEKYSASKFWQQICYHRATLTECIAKIVITLLKQPVKPWEKSHNLRDIFYYLPISDQKKEAFTQRFNVRLLNSYGMTETIAGLIGDRPGDERRWPSIGRIGFCYEAKIIDEKGNKLPPNTCGEIYIKGIPGKTILKEYYNDSKATQRALSEDGWFHTDDMGYMDEDGYFYFIDRKSNLIKRAGENISCMEVENFLMEHPDICEATVIGIPDDIEGQTVKAFIIAKEGKVINKQQITRYCSENLAKFKVPSQIEIRESFPRTSTGKIQKHLLR